jgi:hypothetical protein
MVVIGRTHGQRPTFSEFSRQMSHMNMNKKMNRREAMAAAAALAAAAAVPTVPGVAVPVASMGQLVQPLPELELDAICWGRMRAASDAARFLAALRLTAGEIEALRRGARETSEWATTYPGLRIAQQIYSPERYQRRGDKKD